MTGKVAGHGQLAEFVAELFAALPRADQRVKAELYLRGLLMDGRRKSMQPMAERLGVDHQALQQFMTSSTWDLGAVRASLARRAVRTVRPVACALEEVEFRKEGTGSACVARQPGLSGKKVNCQLGVVLHLVGPGGSAAVNWRLVVPPEWDDTLPANQAVAAEIVARRRRCRVPDGERAQPRWVLALRMLDELAAWGVALPTAVVAGDGPGGEHLRAALERRGMRLLTQPTGDVVAGSVVRLGVVRAQVRRACRELRDDLGVDHFEGRSWIGWNRHVTMASAAQLLLTSLRAADDTRQTA